MFYQIKLLVFLKEITEYLQNLLKYVTSGFKL